MRSGVVFVLTLCLWLVAAQRKSAEKKDALAEHSSDFSTAPTAEKHWRLDSSFPFIRYGPVITHKVATECRAAGMSRAGVGILKKSLAAQREEGGRRLLSPEDVEKLHETVKELSKSQGMTDKDLAYWTTCSENLKKKFHRSTRAPKSPVKSN